MKREIIDLLQSDDPSERNRGWKKLHIDCTLSQKPITQAQRERLVALLMHERDVHVWRIGITVMSGLPREADLPRTRQAADDQTEIKADQDPTLASWLWHPFKSQSAVFGLLDRDHRRRDEVSLIHMSPYFCGHSFPTTEINLRHGDDPRGWDPLLRAKRYESMCFVGRIGIFGEEAVRRWGNQDCRFGFLMQKRPRNVPLGTLHKKYHCITEMLPDGTLAYHQSKDDVKQRLDFGLVQRYLVKDGNRRVVVVNCAGGSALGTLAATIWGIKDLKEALGLGAQPICTPPGLNEESQLEALVHVAADNTGYEWQPRKIELRKLYAGRHVWSDDDRGWKPLTSTHITLVTKGDEVIRIELDGKDTRMQPGTQGFKLLVKLCEGIMQQRDGVVDLKRLARDREIWSGRTVSQKDVRRRLSHLKYRTLHECLVIDNTAVTLTAEVDKI